MSKGWEDYLKQAQALIESGYPVPSDDAVVLAKILFKKNRKDV